MTREQLEQLVEKWRQRLLPEWRVQLMDGPPADRAGDDDYFALAQTPVSQYRRQLIYFPDSSLDRSDWEIEVTVVHELLHGLLLPLGRTTLDELRKYVAPVAYEEAYERVEGREETIIDRLARALVATDRGDDTVSFGTSTRGAGAWDDDEPVLSPARRWDDPPSDALSSAAHRR